MHDDLVLMPEVDVRRALGGRVAALRILAPYGRFAGSGKLRVLRIHPRADDPARLDVVCGYESYVAMGGD